jgi:hypothetical protein
MSTVIMTDESEGLDEAKPFSPIALVAFVLSLVGILSLLYVPILLVAGLAIGLGSYVLLTAGRHDFSTSSKVIASLAIMIGTASGTGGLLGRVFSTSTDLVKAKEIAEIYLDSVHKGEFGRMALLSGMEVQSETSEMRNPTEQEKFFSRKKTISADALVLEVRSRKTPPKWTFVRLESVSPTPYSCSYKLIYRDDSMPISPDYLVVVKRDSPQAGPLHSSSNRGRKLSEIDMTVRWVVDGFTKTK